MLLRKGLTCRPSRPPTAIPRKYREVALLHEKESAAATKRLPEAPLPFSFLPITTFAKAIPAMGDTSKG
eukprot:5041179-Pleurochrysis_carterae.AAC.5